MDSQDIYKKILLHKKIDRKLDHSPHRLWVLYDDYEQSQCIQDFKDLMLDGVWDYESPYHSSHLNEVKALVHYHNYTYDNYTSFLP